MRLYNDIFERILGAAAGVILRHPWKVVGGYLLLAILSGAAALKWLEFSTDQHDLISNDLDYNRRYLEFRKEFGDQDYIFVVIAPKSLSTAHLETAKRIADNLAEELEKLDAHVERVVHRIPPEVFQHSGLLLLDRKLLERAADFVEEHGERMRGLISAGGLAGLIETIPAFLDPAAARDNPRFAEAGLEALRGLLGTLERALAGEAASIGGGGFLDELARLAKEEPWKSLLAEEPWRDLMRQDALSQIRSDGYLLSGSLLFVQVVPKTKDYTSLEVIREPLREIRRALSRVRARFPGEHVQITGWPVLQADEMETTNADMARAAVFSVLGVLLLFMLFFRSIRRPLLTAVALVAAITLTFGITTVAVGHLNLLSIVFAVMLVSLGMEFGIHIIARYQEELAATGSIDDGIRNALLTAGKGNITGATTTAAAFYTCLLVDFKGLQELGFIAGSGVLMCMIAMNSLLPALIAITDRWRLPPGKLAPARLAFLVQFADRPKATLTVCALLALIGLPFLAGARFNANLLDLQAQDLESVRAEKLIIEKSNFSTLYAAYVVDSLDEVRRRREALKSPKYEGVFGKVESILDFVPDDQKEKIELVRRIASGLGLSPGNGDAAAAVPWQPVDAERLARALEALWNRLEAFLSGTLRAEGEGAEVLETLIDALDRMVERIREDPAGAASRLAPLSEGWGRVHSQVVSSLLPMLDPREISRADLPRFIRDRFVSPGGKHVVYANPVPGMDLWKDRDLEEFVRVSREVDALVTGAPDHIHESASLMKSGFLLAALYSMIAVVILIWVDFRKILFTLLTLVPVVLGMVWLVEVLPLLRWLGLPLDFNLANFFSIPIIIGTGIDGGVHIIHRFREDRSAAVATRSTGTAVVLSFLSTMTGFGMMLMAHHRGIWSLGAMMVVGCGACLVASVVALPAILEIVERRRYRGFHP